MKPPPQLITFPSLLGLPQASIKAYRIETTISEKLHAIVKLGMANSRMKDYFDLYYISRTFTLTGDVLTNTINATFDRRGEMNVVEIPVGLTAEFARDPSKVAAWKAFNSKMKISVESESFEKVHELLVNFIIPVFRAAIFGEEVPDVWIPPGSWKKVSKL